jgi:hypothetical protein
MHLSIQHVLTGLGARARAKRESLEMKGLWQELQARLEQRGLDFEWADAVQDLGQLHVVEVQEGRTQFLLRDENIGTCGGVL